MDELKEVKPEFIEESEDVKNQKLNEAPKYTIVGRLKRKVVDDSNFPTLEKVPKQEPLDEKVDSILAPKLEPLEDEYDQTSPFFEAHVKEEEYCRLTRRDSVPLPKYTIWDQRGSSEALEMTEVKEEPLDAPSRNQDFRCGGSWDIVKEEESRDDPYEVHQPAVLNEPKLEEQCTSLSTLWAQVKEEQEEPEYEYEEYETSGYELEEPKMEEPYLSTGSLSNQGTNPLPNYTIWDQKGPSTSQGVYEVKEKLFDEQSPCYERYGVNEPPILNEPKLEGQSPNPAGPPTLFCCLCGVAETPRLSLTNVPVKSELLILAVGLRLAGKLTIQKGQELMARTQSSYSCQEHYEEAAGRIQTALDVEPLRQGLKKIRRHDLKVVNKICPQMTMERFRERFSAFHKEHHKKKPAVTSHCEICNRDQHHTKMTSVTHKGTKYLLAIADMLQGYRKPAQAISFASGTHAKKVCIIHFKSTLNVILERLNLRSASEQPKAQDLVDLMSSVRMVWKDCKTKWFWDTVRWFAVEQQSLKPLMTTTPQAPRKPQFKPKFTPAKPTVPVFLCSLCSKNSPFVRTVNGRNTKLVLAVGACLSKQTEPTSAKEFVASDEPALVCRSHFNATVPSILGHLRILSFIDSPATRPALYVTSVVHSISSNYSTTYEDFVGMVTAFAEDHHLAASR